MEDMNNNNKTNCKKFSDLNSIDLNTKGLSKASQASTNNKDKTVHIEQ